jgi:NADH:ubiquinone oxidoreductase subunit 3 (subunit A)
LYWGFSEKKRKWLDFILQMNIRDAFNAYSPVFLLLVEIVFAIPFIYLVSKFFAPFGLPKRNIPKFSAYECGFQPFSLTRTKVDIKFFLIGLLFLVFDTEILILVPFAMTLYSFSYLELTLSLIFLFGILLGVIWEINSQILSFI